MDTFCYFFSAEDTLGTVADRFRTTPERIRDLSNAVGQKWADHYVATIKLMNILREGDMLIVPVPDAIPSLPAGADWREYPTPPGATVRSVVQALKTPVPNVGRIIDDSDSVVALIWDYYRNARIRRAAVQGGLPHGQSSDTCTIPAGSPLLVPVFPPQDQIIYAAPSPVSDPKTSATIDVKPDDRFSRLTQLLQDVERALDDVDAVRARIAAGQLTAENICTNFIKLKESMEETAEDFTSANEFYARHWAETTGRPVPYDMAHDGEEAREAAIKAIEPLIDKAVENLRGRPVWQKEYSTAEDDLKLTIATLKRLIKSQELMELVIELVPTLFAVPVSVRAARLLRRRRTGVSCLTYICHLAARAAVALANSPTKSDGDVLKGFVGQKKQAGDQCADLIEYACACTRGFESTNKLAANPAPFSCLGVVSTLHIANILADTWTAAARDASPTKTAVGLALNVALNTVFKDIAPFVDTNAHHFDRDAMEAVKEKYEAYLIAKEGAETFHEALDLSEPLKPSLVARFLGNLLSPFDKEGGPLRELIPKSARSFYYAFTTLFETGEKLGKMKESSDSGTTAGLVETYKSSIEFKKTILEGAKALEFIEGEGAELAEAAVDFLGRATFLLTIVVEACEAVEAIEKDDIKAAEGPVALAGSALCFLIGGGTAGAAGAVFIAVGAVLLVGGIVATKGDIAVKLYGGETVTQYNQIKTSPTSVWANNFNFGVQLTTFQRAFDAANFKAGDAASKRLAVGGATRATP